MLGHISFVLFFVPLQRVSFQSTISYYADHTKLLFGRNSQNYNELQNDLCRLCQWVSENNMELNGEKFRTITFEPSGLSCPLYMDIRQCPITLTHSIKTWRDLGLVIEHNGKFKDHVQVNVTKAFQTCQLIVQTFYSRDTFTMKTLYKSIGQPIVLYGHLHLEYDSPIWIPATATGLNKIERVQRRLDRNEGVLYTYCYLLYL